MANKVNEIGDQVVAVRARMDMLIEELKEQEQQEQEIEAVFNKRVEVLKMALDEKKAKMKEKKDFMLHELGCLMDVAEAKETRTQFKLSLLSGDVVRKKATAKFEHDKVALLEWAKANDSELVKQTMKEDVDWATLKSRLVMQQDIEGNYMALDTLTGEIIAAVSVVEVPSKLEVK